MIAIKTLNKSQLNSFVHSDEFAQLEFLPISTHRALSHIKNPRADSEDVLLLLAYAEKKLVGYLGVLPDKISSANNKQIKCGWLSCLWIDPTQRGKKIAYQLVMKALELWQDNIIITEFTASAEKLYHKTEKFVDLQTKKGLRLYVRFQLAKILEHKHPFFAKTKAIIHIFDSLLNSVLDIRFLLKSNKLKLSKIEQFNTIDDEISNFLQKQHTNELFKRTKKELIWILQNPWVLCADKNTNESKKYHFSSIAKSFDFFPIKLKDHKGKLIAFLIFTKREKVLKLAYSYFDNSNIAAVAEAIVHFIYKYRISTFSSYDSTIATYLSKSKTPALLKKPLERKYLIGKKLKIQINDLVMKIQDGDGDCSFT